jgi:beta-lactamase superfamily II metal-dependent hydrolase
VAGIALAVLASLGSRHEAVSGAAFPARWFVPQLARDESPARRPAVFEVAFLDVGQGDATLVTAGDFELLVDGGRSRQALRERLRAHGVTDLDAIVATHAHADHAAGLIEALALYRVEAVYLNGGTAGTNTWATLQTAIATEGAAVVTLARGDSVPVPGLTATVLNPSRPLTGETNEDSIVLLLACGSVEVLLAADAERGAEASMLAAGVVPDVDVLKAGHHGSRSSSSAAFLEAAAPEFAVVSAGATNAYGHPHAETLARLAAAGATVFYTDSGAGDQSLVMESDCSSAWFERR